MFLSIKQLYQARGQQVQAAGVNGYPDKKMGTAHRCGMPHNNQASQIRAAVPIYQQDQRTTGAARFNRWRI